MCDLVKMSFTSLKHFFLFYYYQSDGWASAGGVASGEQSNMTGDGQLVISGSGTGGSANMEAFGGGKGNSAAQTNAALSLMDGGEPRSRVKCCDPMIDDL